MAARRVATPMAADRPAWGWPPNGVEPWGKPGRTLFTVPIFQENEHISDHSGHPSRSVPSPHPLPGVENKVDQWTLATRKNGWSTTNLHLVVQVVHYWPLHRLFMEWENMIECEYLLIECVIQLFPVPFVQLLIHLILVSFGLLLFLRNSIWRELRTFVLVEKDFNFPCFFDFLDYHCVHSISIFFFLVS